MEYVEEILKRADFSVETDLKINLKKELFPPVRGITLDDLMKKNGIKDKGYSSDKAARHERIREKKDILNMNPPKKDGPRM